MFMSSSVGGAAQSCGERPILVRRSCQHCTKPAAEERAAIHEEATAGQRRNLRLHFLQLRFGRRDRVQRLNHGVTALAGSGGAAHVARKVLLLGVNRSEERRGGKE